ncbi:Pirin-like protein [Galdieria sulphuraria]|uniref:Pirin-related protein n=1 Tax=Galdieria sulphuraria TaxID=130081 RepID=M2XA47_GALSU|nr:pirin-related protein [Galdieria sulphuraria]EME26747.1 pirin-related protein [Galdieria sulphuraria]GJD07019.1 Pirin-like protein [Galdieria sulphuraria]|eukprot:XP_005703267.1 pirin-related protein [Galdieria sulphuraria]
MFLLSSVVVGGLFVKRCCYYSKSQKIFQREAIVMASTGRKISKKIQPREQMDGEGARVFRSIGTTSLRNLDPFLMLDEFSVKAPAGFPDHPHRGFETVTYMLEGFFRHEDNRGHSGVIGPGDVQWMTAGRGIIHSEMPQGNQVGHGLQLWVNLAAKDKMAEPKYQELVSKDIPCATTDLYMVKVVAGRFQDVQGKVYTRTPSMFLDIEMKPGCELKPEIPPHYRGFIYVIQGKALFGKEASLGNAHELLILDDGADNAIICQTKEDGCRFVLVAGQPLNEPIVQYGPFVMTSQEDIKQAFQDYQSGKFSY